MTDKFQGFSIPQGTFLPGEFEQVLPFLKTHGEIATLLVILFEYLRPGLDAMPLTIDQIESASGLSRPTITKAIRKLMQNGFIRRIPSGQTYLYEPEVMSISKETLLLMHHESSCIASATSKHLDDASGDEKNFLLAKLKSCGVAARVALDLIEHYEEEHILKHIGYARFKQNRGQIKYTLAAYVVAAIKDDYAMPAGYQDEPTEEHNHSTWFTQEEYDTFFVKPGQPTRYDSGDDHE